MSSYDSVMMFNGEWHYFKVYSRARGPLKSQLIAIMLQSQGDQIDHGRNQHRTLSSGVFSTVFFFYKGNCYHHIEKNHIICIQSQYYKLRHLGSALIEHRREAEYDDITSHVSMVSGDIPSSFSSMERRKTLNSFWTSNSSLSDILCESIFSVSIHTIWVM